MLLAAAQNAATDVALLTLLGGVIAWGAQEWRRRRIRVGRAVWVEGAEHLTQQGRTVVIPQVHLALFNGLQADVGLHGVVLDLRRGRTRHLGFLAPVAEGLPESLRAQHSTVIRLDPLGVHRVREVLRRGAAEEWRFRLRLRLGNGTTVTTRWNRLPDPEESYDPGGGGAGSDW